MKQKGHTQIALDPSKLLGFRSGESKSSVAPKVGSKAGVKSVSDSDASLKPSVGAKVGGKTV